VVDDLLRSGAAKQMRDCEGVDHPRRVVDLADWRNFLPGRPVAIELVKAAARINAVLLEEGKEVIGLLQQPESVGRKRDPLRIGGRYN
jgi:hypothetical protein